VRNLYGAGQNVVIVKRALAGKSAAKAKIKIIAGVCPKIENQEINDMIFW